MGKLQHDTWWLQDENDHAIPVIIPRKATDAEIEKALKHMAHAVYLIDEDHMGSCTFTECALPAKMKVRVAYISTPGDGLLATSPVMCIRDA